MSYWATIIILSLIEIFLVERVFHFIFYGRWYFNYDALGRCFSLHYFLSFVLLGLIGSTCCYYMKLVDCGIGVNSKVDSIVLVSFLSLKIFLCIFYFINLWYFVCFFGFSTCTKITMVQKFCHAGRNNARVYFLPFYV